MKKIFILLLLFLLMLVSACARPAGHAVREFYAFDTRIRMEAWGEGAEEALGKAEAEVMRLHVLWEPDGAASDLVRLRGQSPAPVGVAPETIKLYQAARELSEETDGALDITLAPVSRLWGFLGAGTKHVPEEEEIRTALSRTGYDKVRILPAGQMALVRGSELDFGAVGKGYAAARAANILRTHGISSALLDFGGNIEVIGDKPDGSPWRVAVRSPSGGNPIGVLLAEDTAVVTSSVDQRYFIGADGGRYHHIFDGRTGGPARSGLLSVTVVAKDGGRADALSTAVFVMGKDRAMGYWRAHRDFDMILVTEDGAVETTEGLAGKFEGNGSMTE